MNIFTLRQQSWKLRIFSVLLLGSLSGCSTWRWNEPFSSLDPAVHHEREIARQAKADSFPAANQLQKK